MVLANVTAAVGKEYKDGVGIY